MSSKAGESLASVAYHDLACRIGDEKKTVEKLLYDLFHTLKKRTLLTFQPPNKCITIPKKLKVKSKLQTPDLIVAGMVWHWPDLRHSQFNLLFELLQNQSGKNNCFAATQMEICLNPHHYAPKADGQSSSKEVWATVAYYERNIRAGENYLCSENSVAIGCYNNLEAEDISTVFNLSTVHRTNRDFEVEECRQQIGAGVWLHYYSGQLLLELSSNGPVFVQSHYHNLLQGLEPKMACRLVSTGCRIMRLMDDDEFGKVLSCCIEDNVKAVFEAAKMCTIKLSFGDPWGRGWGVEEDIRRIPCWIEIRLVRQLNRVEKMLEQLGCPYKLHY